MFYQKTVLPAIRVSTSGLTGCIFIFFHRYHPMGNGAKPQAKGFDLMKEYYTPTSLNYCP
jgi:hypothetical protein